MQLAWEWQAARQLGRRPHNPSHQSTTSPNSTSNALVLGQCFPLLDQLTEFSSSERSKIIDDASNSKWEDSVLSLNPDRINVRTGVVVELCVDIGLSRGDSPRVAVNVLEQEASMPLVIPHVLNIQLLPHSKATKSTWLLQPRLP